MGVFSNNPDYFKSGSFIGSQPPVSISNTSHSFNTEEQNAVIRKWIPKVRSNLKANAKRLVNGKTQSFVKRPGRTEGKLADSIRSKTRKDHGVIETVTFQFERHGVFVHKGVSRGHPIGNPRQANEWFNPPLDKYLPELADRIAAINTDAAVNATRMKIN